ncbi:unnamed protein product, partial [Discosporangium mesarthrocarpum]
TVRLPGDGLQTRSFQYVADLVRGLVALMNEGYDQPVNIGNPEEYTVKEFAVMVKEATGSPSQVVHLEATKDDPNKRRPDISLAKEKLGWEPRVAVREGIEMTIKYFRQELERTGEITPTGPKASKPGTGKSA